MGNKEQDHLKAFLDKKVLQYNTKSFIAPDPISIPHRFTKKQDIEISGLFAAIFSWGNRTTIINKSLELMSLMDNEPYDFISNHGEEDLRAFLKFKHRTFNTTDLLYFITFLKNHYSQYNSLESAFSPFRKKINHISMEERLISFYNYFFSFPDAPLRTTKHISTPDKRSACKRLNMYLRWMVRKDKNGVDFGIWKNIPVSELICPLDVHVARVARHFKLLDRKSTDWQAALELTDNLRKFDLVDPVKYDFALFGLGVIEKF